MNSAVVVLGHVGHSSSPNFLALIGGLAVCGLGFWLADYLPDLQAEKRKDVSARDYRRSPTQKHQISPQISPQRIILFYRQSRSRRYLFVSMGLILVLLGAALVAMAIT